MGKDPRVREKSYLRLDCRWAPLEKPWANLVAHFSKFVARNPWPFIMFPIILTALLSSGIFLNFKVVRGVHFLYAPLDAAWKTEEEVFHRNWAASDDQFYPGKDVLRRKGIYLIIQANDGGNVLRKENAKDFLRLLDWIASAHFVTSEGERYSYSDICLHFQNHCFSNAHARLVATVFAQGNQDLMNITYPLFYTKYTSEPVDLSKTLGNVTVSEDGRLVSATTWMILYQLKQHQPTLRRLSTHFEKTIEHYIRKKATPATSLNIYHFHSESFENELAESNRRIIPRFALTFSILIVFSVLCTFNLMWVWDGGHRRLVVDWVISKPFMGIAGVVTTMMAIISAMGLLLLFDVTFVDMCTVMPFLSLTVGIDDTFLMLAAWHESSRSLPVEQRIGRSMRHAAVSISITSLTDSLAFLIGAIAPLPAACVCKVEELKVKYFCYYSAVAIFFIFVYSITIFTALLSLQGNLEKQSANSVTGRPTREAAHAEKATLFSLLFNMGSRPGLALQPRSTPITSSPSLSSTRAMLPYNSVVSLSPSFSGSNPEVDTRLWYQRFFEDKYAVFICKLPVQLFSLLLFIGYVVGAVFGLQELVVGFDLVNIIQMDSPARDFLKIRNALFPENIAHMDVAVLAPPNMGSKRERDLFMRVLQDFEETKCSEGRNSTDFWYFAYQDYMKRLGFDSDWETLDEDKKMFSSSLASFLMSNDRFAHDVLREANGYVKAFRFSTSLKDFGTDYNIVLCCQMMRNLAAKHADYNITTYTPLWNLADQFEMMWPQTMQDLYISVAVMVPIALLFIPQPLCAVMIGLNIASIAFGVLGFMAWWKVNLDATSMITIAMSVGFSVDFAAHVTYAYMSESTRGESSKLLLTPEKRLIMTLGTVSWPVTQASTSVLLGISTLATVDSYVVQTCFKTVLLVVVFGTLHAILFLPLVLMRCHKLYRSLGWKRKTIQIYTGNDRALSRAPGTAAPIFFSRTRL